jgi:RNA polymerase sigma factor (sigma-70 family)
MLTSPVSEVIRYLRSSLRPDGADLTDGQLLECFVSRREPAALEVLVRRHGPMVWGVCCRMLQNHHDAEDAFQATFLVLARKAASIRSGAKVGNWLYGVAHRTALKARATRARRRLLETQVTDMPEPAVAEPDTWGDLQAVLDQELSRLPESYRTVIVLCDLEGRTGKEAARHLSLPLGTVASRLARARAMLAKRLSGHHLPLAGGALATVLTQLSASASVPAAVMSSAIKTVTSVAAGQPVAGAASAAVGALTKGVLKAMVMTRVKIALGACLVGALLLGCAFGYWTLADDKVPPAAAEKKKLAAPEDEKRAEADDAEAPLPAGALARLGTSRFRHAHITSAVAFAPDGKWIASGSHLGTIRIWEAATGKAVHEFKAQTGITSLAYSPDGKALASACWFGPILLWDPETGRQLQALKGFDGHTTVVALTPDGKTLASGGEEKNVRLWDVATGGQIGLLQGHKDEVRCVAFSPDGESVASASLDKLVRVWDVKTGKERLLLEGHEASAQSVAFSPNGKTLASGDYDGLVRLWDAKTGVRLRSVKHVGRIESVAFSPDGKYLAVSTGWGDHVLCWDVEGKWDKPRWSAGQPYALRLSFSGDGKKLVAGSWHNTVRVWDTATGKEEGTAQAPGHQGWVHDLCFLPDGKTLVSAGSDGRLIVWDMAAGREVRRLEAHQSYVWCLALSPDGKTLASGSDDQTIRLWDPATGKERGRFSSKGAVKSLAFSPDGARLAAAGGEDLYPTWKVAKLGEACVWDVASGQRLFRLEGHEGGVKSIAYSPDGRLIATGGNDKTVRLWDAATGQERRVLSDHRGAVEAVAFAPDGRALASADGRIDATRWQQDGAVRLWDVATGEKLREFESPAEWFMRLAFSPDGRTLAATVRQSKKQGPSVLLWEVATGRERRSYLAHQGTAYAVAFAPDGRRLASGGADNAVLLWDVTGRIEKGRQERERYLSDRPRRPACER